METEEQIKHHSHHHREHHHSEHHHDGGHQHGEEHVHHSNRAGHNRQTKSQIRSKLIANIAFAALSIIAAIIVLLCVLDHMYGII